MAFKLKNIYLKFSGLKSIIFCLILLNGLSLLAIYSGQHQGGAFTGRETLASQSLWIAIAWILLIVFSLINYRYYRSLAYFIYSANIILLLAVFLFGRQAMGAQRWLNLFGLTFQPSELSKIALIMVLARIFSSNKQQRPFFLFALGLFLTIFNALLIFKQPDLGTASVLVLLFFFTGFFSRIPKRLFVIFISIGLLTAPLFWNSLHEYQRKRLTVFLDPNIDPLGAGYTIIQSKIAIGSGQFTGKGFLSGTQSQFNFLPERHTDFVFTVIAEEWGLAGCLLLLVIFWIMLKKMIQIAARTRGDFSYFIVFGASALFFLHIFINIGMTLGLLPVVGLPLIFLSYGGTNLVINYILIGIIFNISWK